MSDFIGMADLIQQIKEASRSIEIGDARTDSRLKQIEASINELYRKTGRPGPEWRSDDTAERAEAAEMCRIRYHEKSPKDDGITTKEYVPSNTEIDEALLANRAFRSFLRAGGDLSRLDHSYTKSLSAFSFGGSGFMLPPQTANFSIRCLADPSNLSGLVRSMAISGPSLRILIDNQDFGLGEWACESGCFSNSPQPDLQEGLGMLELKPETIRMTVCTTRDFLEDAATDPVAWIRDKIDTGLSATINNALIVGDGVGKPMGILHPRSGIPVCETSPTTPAGQFDWRDLVMLKFQVPAQWHGNASFIMKQSTFALLLSMSDAVGRPLLQQMPQNEPVYTIAGSPVVIASQMPDPGPGSTPIAFGAWREVYLVVWRKGITVDVDRYSAGFCVMFLAEARVTGGIMCPNKARLLRIR